MKLNLKNPSAYYFEWMDAYSNFAWFHPDQIEEWSKIHDCFAREVGWLLGKNKQSMVFAMRCDPIDGQWGGLHKIPRTWIRKMTKVRLPK